MRDVFFCLTKTMFRRTILLILIALAITGCGSSSPSAKKGGGNNDPSIDNTPIYGAYSMNLKIGGTCEQKTSVVIGDNSVNACDDNYLYLPKNDTTTTGSCGTVTRSGNTITITGGNGSSTKNIVVSFNPDFTSGTIAGTISDESPNACSGAVTGDITLITRTPVEISANALQYRSFSKQDLNGQAAFVNLSGNGQPVPATAVSDVRLYKDKVDAAHQVGIGQSPAGYFQGENYGGSYNKSNGAVDFNADTTQWTGLSLSLNPMLTGGDYIFVVTTPETSTEKSYTVSSHITYPGDSGSPVVSGLTAQWSGADLVLSWTNPSDDYAGLSVTIVKTDNGAFNQLLMAINVDKADGTNSITIPGAKMDQIKTLASKTSQYGVLAMQIQALKYTTKGLNYASGYSGMVILPNSGTWQNLDNSKFYGAYSIQRTVGTCSQNASVIIGDDSSKACNDDYLYLPAQALSDTGTCNTVSRTGANTIVIQTTNGSHTENITLGFNADQSSATLSGAITDQGTCQGPVTGSLTLITRDPITITSGYIASVASYTGPEAHMNEFCIALEKSGSPIASADITGVSVKDSSGASIFSTTNIASIFQSQTTFLGMVNSGLVQLITPTASPWADVLFNNYVTLSTGNYTFSVVSKDGYTVSNTVNFPGYTSVPLVTTGMSAKINTDKTMSIAWTPPTQSPTQSFDELWASIIKTDGARTWKRYLLTIKIDPASGIQSTTVPASIMNNVITNAGDMSGDVDLRMEFQTRKTNSDTVCTVGYTSTKIQ